MTIWVKICGLTTPESIDAAVDSGANAVGFVFHASSPRNVSPAQAAELAQRVPLGVERFAVMKHPSRDLLASVLAAFQPDVLQTDAADFDDLDLPAGMRTLPVYRTGRPLPDIYPARCLYESADSGQGHRADWTEAAMLSGRTRLVLAGGLDPASVTEAVGRVRPYGVDVSSGVESTPGQKDLGKIRAFVAAARAAATY